jgi:hypothetical protein
MCERPNPQSGVDSAFRALIHCQYRVGLKIWLFKFFYLHKWTEGEYDTRELVRYLPSELTFYVLHFHGMLEAESPLSM